MAAHYRQLGWLLWLVALTCSAEGQYGPSFDCKQAKLEIEETICGDAGMARADQFIHDSYQALIKLGTDKNKLIAEQRAWLQSRNHFRDNNRNRIFFDNEPFEQGGFGETEQLIAAFDTRITQLFSRLPPSRQEQLREHYLQKRGYRHAPTDPVEKMVYQQEQDNAFNNMTHDCSSTTYDIIRNKDGLAVIAAQESTVCGGTSHVFTDIKSYCVNGDDLTPTVTSALQGEAGIDPNQLSIDDDRIVEFANSLSAKTLCEATKQQR